MIVAKTDISLCLQVGLINTHIKQLSIRNSLLKKNLLLTKQNQLF